MWCPSMVSWNFFSVLLYSSDMVSSFTHEKSSPSEIGRQWDGKQPSSDDAELDFGLAKAVALRLIK